MVTIDTKKSHFDHVVEAINAGGTLRFSPEQVAGLYASNMCLESGHLDSGAVMGHLGALKGAGARFDCDAALGVALRLFSGCGSLPA